jgi:superfamily II RNA helicase
MNRVEYRLEQIPLNRDEPRLLHVVERLAELGRQGWHVASADLNPHASFQEGPLVVLLEREAEALEAPVRSPQRDGSSGVPSRGRGL